VVGVEVNLFRIKVTILEMETVLTGVSLRELGG
jgi:hypothetical protein